MSPELIPNHILIWDLDNHYSHRHTEAVFKKMHIPIGILLTIHCCMGFGFGFLWGVFKIIQRFLNHYYTVIAIMIPGLLGFLCFSTGLAALLPIYIGRFLPKPWVTHRKQDLHNKKKYPYLKIEAWRGEVLVQQLTMSATRTFKSVLVKTPDYYLQHICTT